MITVSARRPGRLRYVLPILAISLIFAPLSIAFGAGPSSATLLADTGTATVTETVTNTVLETDTVTQTIPFTLTQTETTTTCDCITLTSTVTDTATGAGVHVVGDQPVTRLNIFSIDKVQSVEPYIAIDLEPGQEKHWSYRYSFTAPEL